MLFVLQTKVQPQMGLATVTSRVDEDPFEKQMRLTNEVSEEQVRASTAER